MKQIQTLFILCGESGFPKDRVGVHSLNQCSDALLNMSDICLDMKKSFIDRSVKDD